MQHLWGQAEGKAVVSCCDVTQCWDIFFFFNTNLYGTKLSFEMTKMGQSMEAFFSLLEKSRTCILKGFLRLMFVHAFLQLIFI